MRQNPLVMNWFDRFRVASDDIDAEIIHQEAVLMNCRILHENRCYSEDGLVREICHELSMDVIRELVCNWKQCADVRKRKIYRQGWKHLLAKQMDTQAKALADLGAEQSERYFHIR